MKGKSKNRSKNRYKYKNRPKRNVKESFLLWVDKLTAKKHFYGRLAFLMPVIIVLIAYIAMGVFPFGDQAAMIIDSYHQYVPFFSELHDKIWHGDSLLYSWHGSLGFNFLAVQAYYLASPLNILIALFPASMMIEAFECLIILKIALSGWTAYRYLRHRTGENNYATVIFSGFYALGGFTLAYNWNVMWLDCIVLFPLVVWGVERLINKGDGRLYTIALGLSIFCNYYMAIMVCIFVVLYYFVIWFSKKRGSVKLFFIRGVHFAGCSVLAGGLAAIYLLPTYYTLINSSQGSKPSTFKFYRNFFDVFKQQFALTEPTQLTGAPNIYCGVLVCMLILFYAAAKNIRLREKIARLLVTGFVLVSLNINVLDYIWHGFHFPNNLPGRFSFIYIFMMVVMAYDAWLTLRLTDMRLYAAFFIGEGALFGLCLWFAEDKLPIYTMAVTVGLMAVYMILLAAHRKHMIFSVKKWRIVPMQLLMLLLTVELAGNTIYGLCMNGTVSRTNYTEDRAEVAGIRDKYEAKDTFYRMEVAQTRGRDDVTWHHLNGLSFFSSTADDRLEKLTGALGFYNSGNKYTYKGATPLTDAMMGIRYVISKDEMSASNMVLCEETENKYIYENIQNLSVGYMADSDIADWKIVEGDPFSTQNEFARMAAEINENLFTRLDTPEPEVTGGELTDTGEDKYFYDRTEDEGSLTYQLTFGSTQDVYLYFEASHCESLKVIVDGETETYGDQRGHIVHLGRCDAGKVVTLDFPMDDEYDSGSVKLQVAAFNQDVFDTIYNKLSESQWQVETYDSTHLSGTIQVSEDGMMVLSIPYDEGWTILVDGEQTEVQAVGEAMMGCVLQTGEHKIEMRYVPQGLTAGAGITLVSVLILLAGLYFKSGRFHKNSRDSKTVTKILLKK